MSSLPSIRYYYINLDRAQERRRSAEQQAKDFGLHLERIEAIHGSDLSPEIVQSLGFKEKKRLREHAAPLTMNEHGCLLSHLKTLRAFLGTDADFGVVLEDDFVLADDFAEGMAWLTQKTGGWEVCKLSGGGSLKPYLHIPPPWYIGFQLAFPSRITCATTGYCYTRRGAEMVLESFKEYDQAFDTQLGRNLLLRRIPFCSIQPLLVHLLPDAAASSSINESCSRLDYAGTKRSLSQYLVHRWRIFQVACAKRFMKHWMGRKLILK